MKLFRLPKRDLSRFEEDTPFLKIARYLLIALLFCGVALGFWLNAQRQTAMRAKHLPQKIDRTGSLSNDQQKLLSDYTQKFIATYGISIIIRIQDESFPPSVLPDREKANTFFFGLSPHNKQVHLEMPPLVAATLGDRFTFYLLHDHFPPYFAQENWPEGLASALSLIAEKLDKTLPGRSYNNIQQSDDSSGATN